MEETMVIYQSRCKSLLNDGLALEELNEYKNFKDIMSLYDFKRTILEKQRRKNKRYRTKQKYIELIQIKNALHTKTNVVFGTITLDNKHLNLKENTYIRQIHSWLKNHFIYSILNKDFGSKTEREHYHFVGLTTEELDFTGKKSKKGNLIYNCKVDDYNMGFNPDLCIIDLTNEDLDKTINYLLKINNHSSKIGTKSRVRIIKNDAAKYIIFANALEPSKAEQFYKKIVIK